ncbi:MAG TPA: SHOCT domain-containing protein [Ignavibacteriaceae bacterium]|nr:SHOCT domain-containing protein [Ignavibacterium sp.]HRN27321.1 SHOCT domain-containing protein [Ignavibacteriaceae bacterium]HRP94381.1 SHOCT domain-containing protein [Ignavibacteriaceae bacterium]HRQ54981.1 SHOCT domain-containing protein [Ignavibacteriaceae bacterium]
MFHDHMFGGMWLGWIFWLVILVLIIWFIFNQIYKNKKDFSTPEHETALDILKKRYAKGEITKEQFEQMKKDLN